MNRTRLADCEHKFYFASKSVLDLEAVCGAIQENFQLPDFVYDCESETDAYGRSANRHIAFTVTQTEEYDVIPTWIKGTPQDVNYQILVTFYGEKKGFPIDEIQAFLTGILKAPAIKFHES